MTKKKVLILSASIGTGHTQAARAIEEYVKTIPEECEVEHLDFLSNDVLSIDNIVKETYIKILDVFPMLYDLMYYSSQGYKKGLVVKTLFAWGLKRRMLKVLAEKKPDVLVFTHPFPAGAAALLKRQHRLDIPLVGVITDFAIHQLWVYPQIDVYCVAASQLKDLLVEQSIAADKVVVSGIPVRKAFEQDRWHWDAAHEADKNVLIMGGGLGMGSIKQSLTLLDRLDAVDSFTVVTGYNADLYDELCKMRSELRHPVDILGYTNQIPQLMCRASLLVTKQSKGCARWVKKQEDLVSVAAGLLTHPEELEAMAEASLDCHRDGARIIGKEIVRLLRPQTAGAATDLIYEH